MRFSIITICRNEEKRIGNTLESVYKQNYQDYEHIIEDGMSEDGTLEKINQYKNIFPHVNIRVFSERDNGLYDAMNRAVTRARGEYVCFINSGDYLFDENTLENVAAVMDRYPKMDWYYGECIVIFPNGDEYLQMPTSLENTEGRDIYDDLKSNHLKLNHQSIFAHRSCFQNNLFDTKYKLRAELKWYYICLLGRKKIKKMNFPVCKYSQGGLSERAQSYEIHAREMYSIFKELNLLTEENEKSLPKENNYSQYYKNVYNQWLSLHQAGYKMSEYLKHNKYMHIVIYGYSELGTHLINELKNTEIEIVCLIDRQKKYPFSNIKVVTPNEFSDDADLIIVTALLHYREIKEYMEKRTDCRIVSLEEILEDMWY